MSYQLYAEPPRHLYRKYLRILFWTIVLVSFIGDLYIGNYIGLFQWNSTTSATSQHLKP